MKTRDQPMKGVIGMIGTNQERVVTLEVFIPGRDGNVVQRDAPEPVQICPG